NDIRFAPTVADGMVYFGSGDTLYAVDADTGVEMWRVKYADEVARSPIVSGNTIYIIGDYVKMSRYGDVVYHQSNLYAVRRQNGQQLWKFDPWPGDEQVRKLGNPVVAADGTVYCTSTDSIGDEPGDVYALDGETGRQ